MKAVLARLVIKMIKRYSLLFDAIALTYIWYFLFMTPAHAYFDLGMSTFMLQVIIGLAAAFWFSIKKSLARAISNRKTITVSEDFDNVGENIEKDETGNNS